MSNEELASKVIEFLKNQDVNKWTSKYELCVEFSNDLILNTNVKTHDKCAKLWRIVDLINSNAEEYGCIVITNKKGELKIPTEQEANVYLTKEFKKCCLKFNRYWTKVKALKKDGQMTLQNEIIEILNKKRLSNENEDTEQLSVNNENVVKNGVSVDLKGE